MKKNRGKHPTNKKINYVDTLAPVVILVLTLSFLLGTIIKGVISISQYNDNQTKYDGTINKYEVKLEDIDTYEDEYNRLREKCIEYMKNSSVDIKDIETSVTVTESIYVDSNDNTKDNTNDTMYETGPIYLKDAILIRFINEKGEMKIIASKFEKDDNGEYTYNTVNSSGLKEIMVNNNINNSETSEEITDNISENSYFNDISNILSETITKSYGNIDNELKEKAMQYFTKEQFDSIINSVEHIDSDNLVETEFIRAGKSDVKLSKCDRLIIQIKTINNNNEIYTTIILKIDNNNKIFDVDII